MMIDWVSMVVACKHSAEISDGVVLSVAPGGEEEWRTRRRKQFKGSHDATMTIRTATGTDQQNSHLEISGNPVKWFQGHNLWGTDDLAGLVFELLDDLCARVPQLTPDENDRASWSAGEVQLQRVDVTDSFHLDTISDVRSWLRAAEQTAHLTHRGRGQLVKNGTLYFGQHSRRWALKFYAKGDEITAKGHVQRVVTELPSAVDWANKTLRCELVLRRMELQRIGLAELRNWTEENGERHDWRNMLNEKLDGMTMTTRTNLAPDVFDKLRPALRPIVQSWEAGNDLRQTLPRRTFYKYRSELLPHGIDIATLLPKKEVSNVVPLKRILEAKPATIPDWAIGTSLYFEPRRFKTK